jgi:hypothetical protein
VGSSSQVVVQLKQRLAGILEYAGEATKAGVLRLEIEKAMAQAKDALPDFPSTWNSHASVDWRAWDCMKRNAIKERTERVLESRTDVASDYRLRGEWKAAERLDNEVLQQMEKTVGVEPLKTAAARESLVTTYIKQGRWREAELHEQRVLDIRRDSLGPSHHLTFRSMTVLVSIYSCVDKMSTDSSRNHLHAPAQADGTWQSGASGMSIGTETSAIGANTTAFVAERRRTCSPA